MSNALIFFFALIQLAFVYAFYRIVNTIEAHAARIARLENQKTAKPEPKALERVQARQIFEKPIEQPKAGTVAAKAVKPKVFLSQIPHQAIPTDNGGLEWEPKI